jgi:hypothetical protein
MNNFISTNGQPFLVELKRSKENKIPNLINNLKLNDVETDVAFEETKNRIKQEVMLKLVTLGTTEYLNYSYHKREATWQIQFNGIAPDVYTHKVAIPFHGDRELFYHIPDSGFSFSSADHGLLIPLGNSRLIIEVEMANLEPDLAKQEAEKLFRLTKGFIERNNAIVEAWNKQMDCTIEARLSAKREELIRIFGKKK